MGVSQLRSRPVVAFSLHILLLTWRSVHGWRPAKGAGAGRSEVVQDGAHIHTASSVLEVTSGRAAVSTEATVDSRRTSRSERSASALAEAVNRSSSRAAQELAMRTERVQMLAQLASQLSSGRMSLLEMALDKLGLLDFLTRSKDQVGTAVVDWHEKRKKVVHSCDTRNLPNRDPKIIAQEVGKGLGTPEAQQAFDTEVLAQLDSTRIVRENLASCTKAVDGMIGDLSNQFGKSLKANEKYSQSFQDILDTLDDFKKTATLTKAFEADHACASQFLVSKLDIIKQDIAKLKRVQPQLDRESVSRMASYEIAKRWASDDAKDADWKLKEIARVTNRAELIGSNFTVRADSLLSSHKAVQVESARLKNSVEDLAKLIPAGELETSRETDVTSVENSHLDHLLAEAQSLRQDHASMTRLIADVEGWKEAASADVRPTLDQTLQKIKEMQPYSTEDLSFLLDGSFEKQIEANKELKRLEMKYLNKLSDHSDWIERDIGNVATVVRALCSDAVKPVRTPTELDISQHLRDAEQRLAELNKLEEHFQRLPGDKASAAVSKIQIVQVNTRALLTISYKYQSQMNNNHLEAADVYFKELLSECDEIRRNSDAVVH